MKQLRAAAFLWYWYEKYELVWTRFPIYYWANTETAHSNMVPKLDETSHEALRPTRTPRPLVQHTPLPGTKRLFANPSFSNEIPSSPSPHWQEGLVATLGWWMKYSNTSEYALLAFLSPSRHTLHACFALRCSEGVQLSGEMLMPDSNGNASCVVEGWVWWCGGRY